MKKHQEPGYILIEALVYAGLLIFAALLAASMLVHIVALDNRIETQVTHACQAHNALTLFRRDCTHAPRTRSSFKILIPTEIHYTTPDGVLTWRFDGQRLLRLCTHTRGGKTLTDHAVVLESVTQASFTPLIINNMIIAFTLNLSHNDHSYTTTVYTRSLA